MSADGRAGARVVVLVPAYEPDERLVALVGALVEQPGVRVVVVDDGSGPAHADVVAAAAGRGAEVVRHEVNRGKGRALKTGFAHVRRQHPGIDVVCADCDGQHSVPDVLRVAEAVRTTRCTVLGTRRFTGRVPLRSRVGNAATREAFALVTRQRIGDTQTGLRGYPAAMLPWLEAVPGERFEYELAALLHARRAGMRVVQVDVATIYLDENASSHFRPLVDSLRVYAPLVRFAASSGLAFVVDTVALVAFTAATGALVPSAVAARALSATVNFVVNRHLVFGGARTRLRVAAARYAALVGVMLGLNVALLSALTGAGLGLLPAKVLTEVVLFLGGFVVQRRMVFAGRGSDLDPRCDAPAGSLGRGPVENASVSVALRTLV